MRRLLLVAVVGLVVASVAAAGTTNGTWFGKLRDPDYPEAPLSDLAPGRLVVTATTAVSAFTGRTSATHDPRDATSTCTSQYSFVALQDGWRVFRQKGRSQITGVVSGGAPEGSSCNTLGGGALRIHPAGAKLKVQVTAFFEASDPDGWMGANSGYFRR